MAIGVVISWKAKLFAISLPIVITWDFISESARDGRGKQVKESGDGGNWCELMQPLCFRMDPFESPWSYCQFRVDSFCCPPNFWLYLSLCIFHGFCSWVPSPHSLLNWGGSLFCCWFFVFLFVPFPCVCSLFPYVYLCSRFPFVLWSLWIWSLSQYCVVLLGELDTN